MKLQPKSHPYILRGGIAFPKPNVFKVYSIGLFSILYLLSSCRNSPDVPLTPVLTFDQDVSSIVLNNCATAGCHDASKRRRVLLTYSDVMRYVTPGKPYDSKLFTTTIRLAGNKMPPKGPLSDDQIKVIYIWILQGAKQN